jgi:hypothetical protein
MNMIGGFLLAVIIVASDVDWPSFRGPNGSGLAETTGLPDHIDEPCYATPAIAAGRIYLRTSSTIYCFGKK